MRRARGLVESAFGFAPTKWEEGGLSELLAWGAETDSGTPFSFVAHARDESAWTIVAHSINDLPVILATLRLSETDLVWRSKKDPVKPWALVRVELDGTRTVIQRAASEKIVKRAAEYWTARNASTGGTPASFLIEKS